jgi:hypothetical protein
VSVTYDAYCVSNRLDFCENMSSSGSIQYTVHIEQIRIHTAGTYIHSFSSQPILSTHNLLIVQWLLFMTNYTTCNQPMLRNGSVAAQLLALRCIIEIQRHGCNSETNRGSVKKFPIFDLTRRLITVTTTAHIWSLSWAIWLPSLACLPMQLIWVVVVDDSPPPPITQTSDTEKYTTTSRKNPAKSNHSFIHHKYTKHAYSHISINLSILTSKDHIELLRNFPFCTKIFRNVYIRAGHTDANTEAFQTSY